MSSVLVALMFLHCWTPMTAEEFEICQSGTCERVSPGIRSESGQQCQVSVFPSPTIRACIDHTCRELVPATTVECPSLSTEIAEDGTLIARCSS